MDATKQSTSSESSYIHHCFKRKETSTTAPDAERENAFHGNVAGVSARIRFHFRSGAFALAALIGHFRFGGNELLDHFSGVEGVLVQLGVDGSRAHGHIVNDAHTMRRFHVFANDGRLTGSVVAKTARVPFHTVQSEMFNEVRYMF